MANEKRRLIDAIAYCKELIAERDYPNRSKNFVDAIEVAIADLGDMPDVDAIEVLRCKDCAFWTFEGVGSSTLKRFGSCAKWYPFGNEQHNCYDDDFCSYGERREGE